MVTVSRRSLLSAGAALAGAAALPPAIARAAAIAPDRRTGTIRDVEHVVILMQENRGFDHYFGTMRGVRGFGDRFPIRSHRRTERPAPSGSSWTARPRVAPASSRPSTSTPTGNSP